MLEVRWWAHVYNYSVRYEHFSVNALSSLSRSVRRVAVGQSELNIFWTSRRLFMLVTNDRLVVDDLIWHKHEVYLTWIFLFKSNDKSYDFTTFAIFRLGVGPKRVAVWGARTADIRNNSFSLCSSKEKRWLLHSCRCFGMWPEHFAHVMNGEIPNCRFVVEITSVAYVAHNSSVLIW